MCGAHGTSPPSFETGALRPPQDEVRGRARYSVISLNLRMTAAGVLMIPRTTSVTLSPESGSSSRLARRASSMKVGSLTMRSNAVRSSARISGLRPTGAANGRSIASELTNAKMRRCSSFLPRSVLS